MSFLFQEAPLILLLKATAPSPISSLSPAIQALGLSFS